MVLSTSRRRGHVMGAAMVIVVLAACGGGTTSTKAPVAVCIEKADATEFGDAALCADSGFRLASDDFGFPNWGGFNGGTDSVTSDVLVRLYGADAVCMEGTDASNCTLNPSAQSVLEEWTGAIAGGRCEGMATLAMRYFMGLASPSDFESGAQKTSVLKRPSLSIDQEINAWWATQFMPEVRAVAAKSRELDPVELVNELINGLKNSLGYTIGLYGDGFGHAVTPFAVTKSGSVFSIHIYDNNYPGTPAVVTVDEETHQWSYSGAAINAQGDKATWTGGTGSFELTPMSVRQGPFTDEFGAAEDETKGTTTFSLEVSAVDGEPAGGLLITTASGKRFGIVNGRELHEIPNAIYTIAKEEFGTSMAMVDIPVLNEEYSVQAVSATERTSETLRDVILEVNAPDGSRTHITSRRPLDTKQSESVESAELVYHHAKGVQFIAHSDSTVTVANNRDKVVVRVPKNGRLTESHAQVSSTDAKGTAIITKILKKAAVRKKRVVATTTTVVHRSTSTTTHTTAPPKRTTTTTTIKKPPTTTTTVKKPPTTTTTIKKPPTTTTTTTVVRTSTTVARSTTTTIKKPTTTSSTVP